jgi:hypothetical protein
MNQRRQIVVGLGTGRCGTQSLSALLSMQPESNVLHERHRFRVRWHGAESEIDDLLRWCREASDLRLVGDVGFYYLPSVEYILSQQPDVKFPCMQRDREDTVTSYMRKTRRRNHWVRHRGIVYRHNDWDDCYPKYDGLSKAEAIGRYWDEYYERATQFEQTYPTNFRVFPTDALNSETGQHEILSFLGIPASLRVITGPIRMNARKAA